MEVSKRRGSVVAGSVWESRMKSDEVRGGIKVFKAEQNPEENPVGANVNVPSRLRRSSIGSAASAGKRKTWKSESSEGLDKSPIKVVGRGKSETQKNSEEQCKELSISSSSSSDGIKKSPIHTRKIGASADKSERSPIHTRKLRSDTQKGAAGLRKEGGESGEGQLRMTKSDPIKKNASGASSDSIQLRKTKSELDRVPDEPMNEVDGCEKVEIEKEENDDADEPMNEVDVCEKVEIEKEENDDADEPMNEVDVCEEKEISSSSDNVGDVQTTPTPELSVKVGGDSDDEGYEDEEEEVVDEEIEIELEMEKENFDVKEISIPESKIVEEAVNNKVVVNEQDKKVVISEPEEPKKAVNEPQEPKKVVNEPEPKKVVSAQMRFHHKTERKPVSIPLSVKQSPTIRRNSTIYQNFSQPNSIPKAEEQQRSFPQSQSKLQSLVDLIMWRDVSRSAFVFGMGTFIIISSSYAKDINLSLISAVSYVGLVYLAVIFLYRSLICRGVIDVVDSNYVVREEDAIWMLKLILPYLNEFLSKLKALFSGDPGTTMKLAVLLFVLARCGSFITIWKMAKFGFFGVFTVPKICSSYSAQLTAYANFWIRRFRDAWDSCTHKKAVALGIFGLVWNLSSVVARIWAVFVLFVAFRYYQQHYLARDEWVEDEAGCDETWQEPVNVGVRQKQERAANFVSANKVKKGF